MKSSFRNWDENSENSWTLFLAAYPRIGSQLKGADPSTCRLKKIWERQFPHCSYPVSNDLYPVLEASLESPPHHIGKKVVYRGKALPVGFQLEAKRTIHLQEVSKNNRRVEATYFSRSPRNNYLWSPIGNEPTDWNGRHLPKFKIELKRQYSPKKLIEEMEKWFQIKDDFNLEISFTYIDKTYRLRVVKNRTKKEMRADSLKTNARKIICFDGPLPEIFSELVEKKFARPDIFFIERGEKKSAFELFNNPFVLNL